MKPRKQARTTKSVDQMRELLQLQDARITAALLRNPHLPKSLRKRIAKDERKAQNKEQKKIKQELQLALPEPELQSTDFAQAQPSPDVTAPQIQDISPNAEFRPFVPNVVARRSKSPEDNPTEAPLLRGLATIQAESIASPLTLSDSLNRVLAGFKNQAAGATRCMGDGVPGEIVNAFFWVSREASHPGKDKSRFPNDWLLFTEYRCCFGRKSGFRRASEYQVLELSQVASIDVDMTSLTDNKASEPKPTTFVRLTFNLVDASQIERHIFVDCDDPNGRTALDRIRERLLRVEGLGWPMVQDASWNAISRPAAELASESP